MFKSMKKTSTIIGMVVLVALIAACASKTPVAVTDAFNAMFPGATDTEWMQEEDNSWEAEFEMEGMEYSALFSADGGWLETEWEIDLEELPDTVLKVIELNYAGYEIEEAEWLESPDFKGFELEIIKGGETEIEMEVRITPNGKIVDEEVEEDSEEQDRDED